MSRYAECPVYNESPDPCPKCGATVSGKDAVNGVCQAGVTWDRAEAKERERCAKIVDAEAEFARDQLAAINDEQNAYPNNQISPRYHWQQRVTLAEGYAKFIRSGALLPKD